MLSVNELAVAIVDRLVSAADDLQISVSDLENGSRIIDAGIAVSGSAEAGRLIAEICLGGLGRVKLEEYTGYANTSSAVYVESEQPVIACLASQYAGWSLNYGSGKNVFNALGSGPARALGSREALFDELNYRDRANSACMVLEVDRLPPVELATEIAERCAIAADKLTLILTPTTSECGVIQVVSRVLETALHKIHVLGFPLDTVKAGTGWAPICPVAEDFMTGMGRTNDAIMFAGEVCLRIDADDDRLAELTDSLPSSASGDYGRLFSQVFKEVNYDFYQIDPMLFSPARVAITSTRTGGVFEAGKIDRVLLEKSFAA